MTETKAHAPARILLVEDSEHDRRFFCRIVESEGGFTVDVANDPDAGLKKLKKQHYDILVADLNLPGMDGLELVEAASELLSDTAVIILTGSKSVQDAARAVRLHVMDYILKEPRDTLRDMLPGQLRSSLNQLQLKRENRRLERELQLRLTHLEQTQQLMPDALFATVGADGTVLEVNEGANEFLEVGADAKLTGKPLQNVLAMLSEDLAASVGKTLTLGLSTRNQYVDFLDASGRARLLLLNLQHVGERSPDAKEVFEGEAPWVLILRDVTPEPQGGESRVETLRGVVGQDPAILQMCDLIRRVAPMPTSVLITGPTGSGKEVVARAIHEASDRANKPFIAVNCTALSREILESELFGHVRGAFTGAISARKGRFREANGGTLLLDEIGDTSESFQTKLLRVLEAGEIEPVGQDSPIKVDVRILCATNRDLPELVAAGKFREDLYYRIDVVHIEVAPLAARPGDMPLLIEHFRREFNERFKKSIRMISQDAVRVLASHNWPGNVRELRHVMERAFVVAEGPVITRADLPPALLASLGEDVPARPPNAKASAPALEAASETDTPPDAPPTAELGEVARIKNALDESRGNISRAATLLKVHRTTLWRKMRQHGIEV